MPVQDGHANAREGERTGRRIARNDQVLRRKVTITRRRGYEPLYLVGGLGSNPIRQCSALDVGVTTALACSSASAARHSLGPRPVTLVRGGPEHGLLTIATMQVIKSLGLPATVGASWWQRTRA